MSAETNGQMEENGEIGDADIRPTDGRMTRNKLYYLLFQRNRLKSRQRGNKNTSKDV